MEAPLNPLFLICLLAFITHRKHSNVRHCQHALSPQSTHQSSLLSLLFSDTPLHLKIFLLISCRARIAHVHSPQDMAGDIAILSTTVHSLGNVKREQSLLSQHPAATLALAGGLFLLAGGGGCAAGSPPLLAFRAVHEFHETCHSVIFHFMIRLQTTL